MPNGVALAGVTKAWVGPLALPPQVVRSIRQCSETVLKWFTVDRVKLTQAIDMRSC